MRCGFISVYVCNFCSAYFTRKIIQQISSYFNGLFPYFAIILDNLRIIFKTHVSEFDRSARNMELFRTVGKENPVACFSRQATGFHYTAWGSGFAANLSTSRPCRRPGLRLPWRRRPWGRACRRPGIRSSGRRRRWTRRSPERCA